MKITYIEHSGFLLETEDAYFLFDYYMGKLPEMDREKPLVVFVSHKHSDHYNPEIFELIKSSPETVYILARGVPLKWKLEEYNNQGINLENCITLVVKNSVYDLELCNGKRLKVTTLKSTDAGVAYLISYEGKTYYHGGDLNLWLWEGETKQYNDNMSKAYFRELEKLKGMKIDVAFVPLDPRQENNAFCGLEAFMEYTDSKWVFPMHFWGEYDIIPEFLEKHQEYANRIAAIERNGQVFEQ